MIKKYFLLIFLFFFTSCSSPEFLLFKKEKEILDKKYNQITSNKKFFIVDVILSKKDLKNYENIEVAEMLNVFNSFYLKRLENKIIQLIKTEPRLKKVKKEINNKKDIYARIIYFYNLEELTKEKIKELLKDNKIRIEKKCNKNFCKFTYLINKKYIKQQIIFILKKYYYNVYRIYKDRVFLLLDEKGFNNGS